MNPQAAPSTSPRTILPDVAPSCPYNRLLLFSIRRMAAGGLDDAFATHALFAGFGINFRRPLILLRALMAETSRVSTTKLMVAPCCCGRMTADEARIVAAVAGSLANPRASADSFATLLHVRSALGVLTSAQAVAAAFADLGMPLSPVED